MAEAQASNKPAKTKKQVTSSDVDEEALTRAMRARVSYFREQADSLNLKGVRRVLEKDLGLEEFALDTNKDLIKQCFNECFDAANNEDVSKSPSKSQDEVAKSTKEETPDFSEKLQPHQELKTEAGADPEKTEGVPSVKEVSEDAIKKTITKRAAYFRTNSETISLAGARRLLEEDLKIDKHALDPYKAFIKDQIDIALQSSRPTEPANGVKNKKRKKGSSGGSSDDEVKPKKKIASKSKTQDSDKNRSRKVPSKEITEASNKRKKQADSNSEGSDDAKDGGNVSEDGSSRSSVEEPSKKKSEPSTQIYGKRVEHLKSVIRSCGMSVPPSVYKKIKQESKREACLIKELEDILRKEGLSTNPSEKEIKAVKKQKERTKELEGIDLSNIVSSSRRRSSSGFVPPPPPKISSSDEEDSDDEDNDDDDDDGDDDEVVGDSEGGNEDDAVDDSNSEEELNEDVEDESD